MNWTKASAVAEILSSVAILITLLYLVVEIGQNTEALQASSRDSSLEGDIQRLFQAVNTPEIWLNSVNPNMTDAEKISQSAYLFTLYRLRERDWLQYQAGAMDEQTWSAYQIGLIGDLKYSEVRKWWNYYFADTTGNDFVDYVNGLLEDIPITTELSDIRATADALVQFG